MLIISALALAVSLTTGCKSVSSLVTPATLQAGITATASAALQKYPQYTGEVQLAADIICADAASTNLDPATVIADLQASGVSTNGTEFTLIVDVALFGYELAYNSLVSANNQAAAQPYLAAVCAGLNAALPAPASAMKAEKPNQQWPLLR